MHKARYIRRVGLAGGLGQGKCVHISAKPDDAVGIITATTDDAHDARLANAGHDLIAAEFTQLLLDDFRGPMLLELQLRISTRPFGLCIACSVDVHRHLARLSTRKS